MISRLKPLLTKAGLLFWSLVRRLERVIYPTEVKTRGFVAEVLLLAASIFVYTPLVVDSCVFYTAGGVTVNSYFGGSAPTSTNGLSIITGLPPDGVIGAYVIVTALIFLDLFVGVRALVHLRLMCLETLKELRSEKKQFSEFMECVSVE